MTTSADRIAAASDIVQTVALIAAGLFAYVKFLRGRTFAFRAEPRVSARRREFGGQSALVVRVEVTNTGLAKIPLHPYGAWIDVSSLRSSAWYVGEAEWRSPDESSPPQVSEVLRGHQVIEPGETVRDEQLIVMPGGDSTGFDVAYRVTVTVAARPSRIRRSSDSWTASTIAEGRALKAPEAPDRAE